MPARVSSMRSRLMSKTQRLATPHSPRGRSQRHACRSSAPLSDDGRLAHPGALKAFVDVGVGRRALAEIQRETWMGEDVFVVDVGVDGENETLYQ